MSVLYFLISCSVLIALFFLAAFFWAMKNGQHEDTYTPAIRMLFDDEETDHDIENPEQENSQIK